MAQACDRWIVEGIAAEGALAASTAHRNGGHRMRHGELGRQHGRRIRLGKRQPARVRLNNDFRNVIGGSSRRCKALDELQARLDCGVRILAAGEKFVIPAGNRPMLAEICGQHVRIGARSKAADEDVINTLGHAAETERCQIGCPQAGPGRDPGPEITDERALDRMIVGTRKHHRGASRNRCEQRFGVVFAQQADPSRGTKRAKGRMRMHRHACEGKGPCEAPDNFVAERQGSQYVHCTGGCRLSFSQQAGQYVSSCMRRRETIALVQFAPRCR